MSRDPVTDAHYELTFQVAFLKGTGNEFQDLFSSIMEKRYPADFIRVRPWGNIGDRKNDGYLPSSRTLFQVYAPNEMKAAACVAKIDEDFAGGLEHWEKYFDTWIFVHNSPSGLGPDVTAKLLELKEKHPQLTITHWGYEELRLEVMSLAERELASLFGIAPSRTHMIGLGLEDLTPVLDHIARFPPLPEPDLRPVPADKIEKNLLSDAVATLLRAGMSRVDLVRKYFRHQPTLQDQLAESFRLKYQTLRNENRNPDDVFVELQKFAGGELLMSASAQSAVLACLAFFFEECDIFERPEVQTDIQK